MWNTNSKIKEKNEDIKWKNKNLLEFINKEEIRDLDTTKWGLNTSTLLFIVKKRR